MGRACFSGIFDDIIFGRRKMGLSLGSSIFLLYLRSHADTYLYYRGREVAQKLGVDS